MKWKLEFISATTSGGLPAKVVIRRQNCRDSKYYFEIFVRF